MILRKTHESHKKILITVWECFKSLRKKGNRLLKVIKKNSEEVRRILRIFNLYIIIIIWQFLKKTSDLFFNITLSLTQCFVQSIQFSSDMSLLSKKIKLFCLSLLYEQLQLIMNTIKNLSWCTHTWTITISALSTFLIWIYDDTRTALRQTVLIKHHYRIVMSVNFLKSVKTIVRKEFLRHDE